MKILGLLLANLRVKHCSRVFSRIATVNFTDKVVFVSYQCDCGLFTLIIFNVCRFGIQEGE